MNKGSKQVLSIILAAVIALGFGFGGGLLGAKYLLASDAAQGAAEDIANSNSGTASSTVTISLDGDISLAEAIADKVMPSVVGISTVSTQTYSSGFGSFDYFFGGGGGYSYDATSEGTGLIVDEAGYILTNSHVVNDGDTKSIMVSLYDGTDVEGTVLWNDATLDLAVIKVEAKGLVAAELGDSDTVRIGAYAAVIGNPLGLQFERSMSQGIISGLDRTIQVSSDGTSTNATTMEGLIQTDATINSGNSGGPLLNAKGQVVGIASARASSGENMGFAIPINTAKPIVEQIKETGSFNRAYIGISGVGLEEQTQYTSEQCEEYFGTSTGIYITKVFSGGGADGAGLKQNDIILKVDGTNVTTMNKINSLLVKYKVGDQVEVEYMRDKKIETCTVTLNGAMLMSDQQIKNN